MSKLKLFHAGRGLWEIRRYGKTKNIVYGIGHFYTKKEALKLIRLNKGKK